MSETTLPVLKPRRRGSPLSIALFALATVGSAACSESDGKEEPNYAEQICNELDRCNYLESGVSALSCTNESTACAQALSPSEKGDYDWEVQSCFSGSADNCKDFKGCIEEMSYCSPIEPDPQDECVEDGEPCDYCWGGSECPESYFNAADGCDCDCSNYVDPDCE